MIGNFFIYKTTFEIHMTAKILKNSDFGKLLCTPKKIAVNSTNIFFKFSTIVSENKIYF